VEIRPGPTFSSGEQRKLFSAAPYATASPIQAYSVSPDDKRFLMMREGEAVQQSEIIIAENWLQQLKAKAPN
jgi:hypothetical protein